MRVPVYRALVECIRAAGVRLVACVPGESFLGVMDTLHEDPEIRLISARHEAGASFLANGYARASGRPGVCFGTRGVGATNLSIGIHTARQDSTPLLAVIGQVGTGSRHREAIQEIDLMTAFGPLTKWAVEATRADRVPELAARAMRLSVTGRPGPVLLAVPADLMDQEIELPPPEELALPAPPRPRPGAAEVEQALALLAQAERPALLVGGGAAWSGATAAVAALAEALDLPVITAFQRGDAFPQDHSHYVGPVGPGAPAAVAERLLQADVVLALGTRLGEGSTLGYRLGRGQRLIHVDVDANVVTGTFPPTLAICADSGAFAGDLLAAAGRGGVRGSEERRRQRRLWLANWREATAPDRRLPAFGPPAPVHPAAVVAALQAGLPADAAISVDVGNFYGWFVRYYRFRQPGTFFAPTSSAMGYGLPAALGVKIAWPERTVVAVSGDGGFLMGISEWETAVRYRLPVLAVVMNNDMYGTIRGYQVAKFPGRYPGTALTNPDYARLSQLFGAHGETVERAGDLPAALDRALAATRAGQPALLHVRTDPAWISPDTYVAP